VWRVLLFGLLLAGCRHEAAHGRSWVHKLKLKGLDRGEASALSERLAVEQTGWPALGAQAVARPLRARR
jgi:hypothetical protein